MGTFKISLGGRGDFGESQGTIIGGGEENFAAALFP
jgi:hypothetical protein